MSENKVILLVDDDQDFIDSYTLVLAKEGFEVKSALRSDEGLALAKELKPDLIVLDVMMESADSGFDFARNIKEAGLGIPIILSSSIANAAGAIFDLHELNVKVVIQKPVEFKEFVALVKKYSK